MSKDLSEGFGDSIVSDLAVARVGKYRPPHPRRVLAVRPLHPVAGARRRFFLGSAHDV
jgi:hypothetical protein